jgi:short-subunit dehydrogenase
MIEQIEIPESFPGPGVVSGKQVVITGASRGLAAVLAHPFSGAGTSVARVAGTKRDVKAVSIAPPRGYLLV